MKRTGELKRKTPPKARKPLSPTKRSSVRHKPAKRQRASDKRFRSEEYLAFVRTLPCSLCGTTQGVIAHHMKGMWHLSGEGLKAPDSFCMPLCDGPGDTCHRKVHNEAAYRDRQPEFLRRTIRAGLAEFAGDIREELTHALAFVEAKAEPPPFKRCPYNDCGWCYAPTEVENNAVHGQCQEPRACPALIEATEAGQ